MRERQGRPRRRAKLDARRRDSDVLLAAAGNEALLGTEHTPLPSRSPLLPPARRPTVPPRPDSPARLGLSPRLR